MAARFAISKANNDSISNLRRRVAGEPALSEIQYVAQNQSQKSVHRPQNARQALPPDLDIKSVSTSEMVPQLEDHISEGLSVPPTQCLFCSLKSSTLNTNIDHMSTQHGLFILSPDQLSDMESFLGYLATIVFEYNECLYCGIARGTVDGVQTHMRDKGHCMINMNANSELLDFWEVSDSESNTGHLKTAATMLSETEMRLPSGAIINSRSDTTQLRTKPSLAQSRSRGSQFQMERDEMKALTAEEQPNPAPSRSNDRRIAVRGEMGLTGVPESQIRALQITEKKMIRREAVAKAARRHASEHIGTKANQGKYYKVGDYDD